MRDPETFETRLTAAYRRFADEVGADVDPTALARTIALRPVRTRILVPRFHPLRLAVLLGLLAVVAIAAAVVVGSQPSPLPAPAVVSNGLIAFAANPNREDTGLGEFRDIYVTGEGIEARRIIGSDDDSLSQGCPSFSPDGTRLAYGEADESIRPVTTARGRWPVTDRAVVVVGLDADGQPSAPLTTITLPINAGLLPCPEWSPEGRHLAFLTGPELWVADAVTGATTTFPVEAPQSEDLEWSPDGSAVAVNEPGRIRSIPIDGTAPIVLPVIGNVHSLDWTSDGRQIVYFTVEGAIRAIAIEGGDDKLLEPDGWSSGAGSLAVSPDGSKLAYLRGCFDATTCDEEPVVVVMDIDGSNETVLTIPPVADPPLSVVSGLSWSPDGQRLLLITNTPTYAIVSVGVTPGSPPAVYPSLGLNFEFVGIPHLSWQPVLTASTVPETTPLPRPSATARPSLSTVPSVPPAATHAASPDTIGASGTTDTAIGQLSWTKVQGDASNVPFGQVFQTPSGFAVIEPDLDRRGSRFWVSSDGIDWVIAPMPVPAAGVVGMGQAVGEHWIWSQTDFRLWRSSDFDTWTEVGLDGRTPAAIEGIDWGFSPSGPVAVGTTTLLPWRVFGTLAVAELLGIPLAPGEMLSLANRGDPPPAPGERDIYRGRSTRIGSDEEDRVRVESIRVEASGSIVTVFDATRDIPVARIDATTVGIPAADLAANLEEDLSIDGPGHGVVIADGDVQGFAPPPGDVTYLDAREGRFIALTENEQSIPGTVWSSANGLDWESLGPSVLPLSSGTPHMGLLERSPSDPKQPMTAAVLIDEADTQRLELWSSADGQTWAMLGLVYTYPGTSLNPMRAPIGYLATGDDFRIHVSATGAEWSIVDGPEGVGRSPDDVGRVGMTSSTSAGTFTLEAATDGARTLWMFTVDPAATPSP